MSVLVHDCPHCGAKDMTMQIFGAFDRNPKIVFAAACSRCREPVSGTLLPGVFPNGNRHSASAILQSDNELQAQGAMVIEVWPEPQQPDGPAHLPASVARAFRQGEVSRLQPDMEEPAATMYRRALDIALKVAFPEVKGDLIARIRKLVGDHTLPVSIGEWAHQVRVVGNDGAHDLEGATAEDVAAARDFVDAVLKYVFTLPHMVALRRGQQLDPETGLPQEAS